MRLGPAFRKIAFAFRRKQFDSELDEEVRLHLDLRARALRERNADVRDAMYAARRRFGNSNLIQQESRDMWGGIWFETLMQDVRYALRQFRKAPGFTAVVIATLALGIGVNTAIFSIINGVVLRPLPYPESDRLVHVTEMMRSGEESSFAYYNYLDCRKAARSFSGMAAYQSRGGNLTAPGEAAYVSTRRVTAGFFGVFGVHPALGRDFLAEEDGPGKPPVAILSHSEWLKRFGNDPRAIGSSIILNGRSYTVVGVLPQDFRYLGNTPVFTPLGQADDPQLHDRRMQPGIEAVARLTPGTTVAQANAELDTIGRRLAAQYPDANLKRSIGARLLKRTVVGDVEGTLYLLAGAVGLVLLIACANVANLFLARSISRDRELAVRGAVGASRGRILRQILTESTLLGIAGGVGGFLIAALGTRAALAHLPGDIPRVEEIVPDIRVLLFTLLVAVIIGIVFGLAPALRSRSSLEASLRQGARGSAQGLRRIQSGFVMAEVGLAVVLLAGAGLMIRTMSALWSVSPGFNTSNLMVMGVALSPKVAGDPPAMRLAWQRIFERVGAVPGVESVSLSDPIPMTGDFSTIQYWTSAAPPPPDKQSTTAIYLPTPDYLRTMKIPLLRGRFFNDRDKAGNESVVVIDQNLAERAFSGRDPVGARLNLLIIGPVRVVGVVGHVKHFGLDEDPKSAMDQVYFPFAQVPDEFLKGAVAGLELLVRTSVNPQSVVAAVREGVMGPGRDQPVQSVQTMEQIIGDSLGRRRLMLLLLGAFAGASLILAAVGIYGVLSYSTSQRVPEIGIRLALGAQPQQVLQLILRQGMLMAAAGLVVGAAASVPLNRLLSGLIYGVRPYDPVTFGGVILLLAIVAFLATYIPARRAANVDPIGTLRHD